MPATTTTTTTIHWGKVLKGAAVIATAVVAAAVVYYAAPILFDKAAAFLGSDYTLSSLAGTVIDAGKEFVGWLGGKADLAWDAVTTFWKDLPTTLGLSKTMTDVVGTTASIKEVFTTGTALAAGGAAAATVAHTLNHNDFVTHHTVAVHGHDLAHHASHAATERAAERKPSWTARVGNPAVAPASRADAVRATRPVESTYAAQMQAETAALDKALSK